VKGLAWTPALVERGRRIGSDLEALLVRRYSYASPVPAELVRFTADMIASTRLEVISDFLPTFSTHDKREALATLRGHEVLVMSATGICSRRSRTARRSSSASRAPSMSSSGSPVTC